MQVVGPSHPITLRALVTARWVMIAIMALLGIVFSGWVPSLDAQDLHLLSGRLAIGSWYAVIALWAAANAAAHRSIAWLARHQNSAGLQLVGDALMLSAFLALSGGAANPFTILYFVPVMLATQVSPRWTWGLAAVCLLFFGLLFVVGTSSEDHSGHFAAHLKGMWLAFAVSGALITFFVHRIAVAIVRWRQELYALRVTALHNRQLSQIGSLAAGAAHELGTPLATITVLVGELTSMSSVDREEAIESIQTELLRCKGIIASMANTEVRVEKMSSSQAVQWPVEELATVFSTDLDVAFEGDCSRLVTAHQSVVVQILKELIANADTSSSEANVRLRVSTGDNDVRLTVEDDGPGMTAEVAKHAQDPFFTTREEQAHMGLGLFLANTEAHKLGGRLIIDSQVDVGTQVTLILPLAQEARS